MPILVGLHLREAEDGVLALAAVVVGLLAVVGAPGDGAVLGGRVLFKAGGHDAEAETYKFKLCGQELGQLADLASDWLFVLAQPIRSQLAY